MCVCVKVCVCVHDSWLKVRVETVVAYCKRANNFQMDSQTCTEFSEKVSHEAKDS